MSIDIRSNRGQENSDTNKVGVLSGSQYKFLSSRTRASISVVQCIRLKTGEANRAGRKDRGISKTRKE